MKKEIKKRWAVVAVYWRGNECRGYTCEKFERVAEAREYMRARCYDTPTRAHKIVKL